MATGQASAALMVDSNILEKRSSQEQIHDVKAGEMVSQKKYLVIT